MEVTWVGTSTSGIEPKLSQQEHLKAAFSFFIYKKKIYSCAFLILTIKSIKFTTKLNLNNKWNEDHCNLNSHMSMSVLIKKVIVFNI